MFQSYFNQAFSIAFDNGWTVCIDWGMKKPSELAQLMAWDINDKELDMVKYKGWKTPAQVLEFLNMVANFEKVEKLEG